MRRILLIFLGLTALVGAGALLYVFISNPEATISTESGTPFPTSDEYTPTEAPEEEPLGEMEGRAGEEIASRLIRITKEPVALGTAVFPITTFAASGTTSASGTPLTALKKDVEVRYVERANGNAYAYRSDARSLARISNRTLPGVQKASWLSDGSMVFAQFISNDEGETVETYALPVGKEGGGYFLEPNLSEVVARGTTTIVTLLPSTAGSIATIASPDGTGNKTLFSSTLSRLQLSFLGQDLLAYTSASSQAGGYAFSVNRSSGTFERILGPLRGLTAIGSPKGSFIFYTYLSGSSLRAGIFDTKSKTSTAIPLGALAEKCVWTADETALYCAVPKSISGSVPDDWYQGATSFSDRIWRIDMEGRVAVLVIDPSSVADIEIDAVSLAIDVSKTLLVFINKTDGSLWSYSL